MFLIFFSDQITKQLIKANLAVNEIIEVFPFLNIVYVQNTGSAFGMFKSLGKTFFVFFTILAISILIFLFLKEKTNKLIYCLLIAGATGNLLDRILYGYVIDFIDLYIGRFHWPAFNIADTSLTIGIIILFYNTLIKRQKPTT